MRLYDQLTAGAEVRMMPPDAVYTPPNNGELERALKQLPAATRINVQNVMDYAHAHVDFAGALPDVANGRLPWPVAWTEFQLNGHNCGVLSTETEPGVGRSEVSQRHLVFIEQTLRSARILFYLAHVESWLDRHGNPVAVGENAEQFRLVGHAPPAQQRHEDHENVVSTATAIVHVVQLAMTFAHCKNVKIQEHHTPPKVAAKRKKAGKPPGISYKTLLIDPMKEVLRTEGNIERNGLKKALHNVRGHFATYTEDKPLFGKVTGTFWKPMHVRGNKKHGEVKKDYAIAAPSE